MNRKGDYIMKRILLFMLISVLLVGCGTDRSTQSLPNAEFGEDDYMKVTAAQNELGFHLLREVDADDKGNTFVSPTSLFLALSMVFNGAEGQTRDEIQKALQLADVSVEELNKANASLVSLLTNQKQIELDIANSLWLNENYHFASTFQKNMESYYGAQAKEINVSDSTAVEQINEWVKKATRDKIERIVEAPLDDRLVLLLANAMYFNGEWTHAFDEKGTSDEVFTLVDGKQIRVPLMSLQQELDYMENDLFQAVSLPYGEGEMVMNIVLPKEGQTVQTLLEQLTQEQWQTWKTEFFPREGLIRLPKFQMEYETNLNETLQQLGMEKAFGENAEFPTLVQEKESVFISEVKQKTYIDVNEKGTEAAAVTSIQMKMTAAPLGEPFIMEVTRPFVVTITDQASGAHLFMGTIHHPTHE